MDGWKHHLKFLDRKRYIDSTGWNFPVMGHVRFFKGVMILEPEATMLNHQLKGSFMNRTNLHRNHSYKRRGERQPPKHTQKKDRRVPIPTIWRSGYMENDWPLQKKHIRARAASGSSRSWTRMGGFSSRLPLVLSEISLNSKHTILFLDILQRTPCCRMCFPSFPFGRWL